MARLKDKSIIVTGGSAGMGAATVRLFAEEGARVLFCARDEAKGKALEEEITKQGGICCFIQADAGKYEDNVKLVEKAVELYGRIDCVVCNAGHAWPQPFHEISPQDWDDMVKLNINGAFYLCKCVIPHMMKQNSGSVIFLGSGMTPVPQVDLGHYIATKGTVEHLARCLSLDYCRNNIRFNVYSPGPTRTEAFARIPQAAVDAVVNTTPMRRLMEPEEAVKGLVFLASDESEFVFGTTIHADQADSCGKR